MVWKTQTGRPRLWRVKINGPGWAEPDRARAEPRNKGPRRALLQTSTPMMLSIPICQLQWQTGLWCRIQHLPSNCLVLNSTIVMLWSIPRTSYNDFIVGIFYFYLEFISLNLYHINHILPMDNKPSACSDKGKCCCWKLTDGASNLYCTFCRNINCKWICEIVNRLYIWSVIHIMVQYLSASHLNQKHDFNLFQT